MRSFRIGRVLGIDLRVDWSWVFIFVLLTWNLVSVFSGWHPDWARVGVFALAAAASLTFFGCVLLHELAHSVVAMAHGLRVRSITLFLFGGVSNIEQEPPSAKAEFLTAIVGPIASIALGVGFLALASVVTPIAVTDPESAWAAMAQMGPLATLLVWLGPINIMIGVFNMIPGFPLDGGRVLRSIIWGATGDLRRATRWASGSGQLIGWLLIGGGIAMTFGAHLPFFGTGLISGLWLAFIGWFLHGAATRASTKLALDEALDGMTVEQLMQRQGPIVAPAVSVATLVHRQLLPGDDRALPVVDADGRFVGLVGISDVRAVPLDQWAATPVSTIMRNAESLTVATPEQPLVKAFEVLALQDIEQLPVVVNGTVVGMLRRRDISRWLELAWKPPVARGRGGPGSAPVVQSRAASDFPPPHHAGRHRHA